ncbi:MAG: signal peptidase II [Deltaproteobacteria bacterium]|nr:signal peptidase II [Deltaproteobacteria bacterium]
MQKKWLILIVVGVLSVVADQGTKIWARHSLPVIGHGTNNGVCVIPEDMAVVPPLCGGQAVTVIDGYWDWRLSMNHGSAFGLFANSPQVARWFLSLVGIGAVIAMFLMMKKAREDQTILHWALALVVGGAIGNLLDRMYFGVVTDFVLWHYHTKEWPVFNVADVVLVVGVGLMFIDIQKEKNKDKRSKSEKSRARDEAARKAGLIKEHKE